MDATPPLAAPPPFRRSKLALVGWFLWHRWTRASVAWLVLLGITYYLGDEAWHYYDVETRRDGNGGHATIDFGGQWLMGRMLLEGHGRHLYNRHYQWLVTQAGYPRDGEDPRQEKPDAEQLMDWMRGDDDVKSQVTVATFGVPLAGANALERAAIVLCASEERWTQEWLGRLREPRVGGPLYPPVNAFYYAPLAHLPPTTAYRVMQVVGFVMVYLSGLAVWRITRGRVWWSVATLVLFFWPGLQFGVNLGQNPPVSMAIVLWGWALLKDGHPILAGVLWGMLSFKPVWAVAFFLVPLITRRWRMLMAMGATGLFWIALTLPTVGVESWRNWFLVGRMAADTYDRDENWILLSRDMLGLPRRHMLNFDHSYRDRTEDAKGAKGWLTIAVNREWREEGAKKEWFTPILIGWALMIGVLEVTTRLAQLRPERQAVEGPAAACVLLGAYTCCYHFIVYDVVLSAVAVFVLFCRPWGLWQWVRAPVGEARPTGWLINPLSPLLLLFVRPGVRGVTFDDPPAPAPRGRWRWAGFLITPVPLLVLFIVLMPFVNDWLKIKDRQAQPWDQYGLMALWLWCAVLWVYEAAHGERGV